MVEAVSTPGRKETEAWAKRQLNTTVQKLISTAAVDSLLVEAKPAWVLPFQILIGKLRAHGQSKSFDWFICGEVPTDTIESSVASNPREAAKYFSMKWQLAAARHQAKLAENPSENSTETSQENPVEYLAEQAEALYELVEDDRLWLQKDES